MKVTVLTAIYGGFDELATPPPQTVDARWIAVTDRPVESDHWEVVVEPRPNLHPRLAAKVPKCLPHRYTESETTVWMDGACRFLRPDTLEWLLGQARGHLLTQFDHPWRQCIYDEAEASQPIPKYQAQPVIEQAARWEKRGHPEQWGLWATGLIVSHRVASVVEFGESWFAEQVMWSYQDQVSQAPLLRIYGIRPHVIDGPLHGNGYLEWHQHRDES